MHVCSRTQSTRKICRYDSLNPTSLLLHYSARVREQAANADNARTNVGRASAVGTAAVAECGEAIGGTSTTAESKPTADATASERKNGRYGTGTHWPIATTTTHNAIAKSSDKIIATTIRD